MLTKQYYTFRNNKRPRTQFYEVKENDIPGQKYRFRHHMNIRSLAENLKHESSWEKGYLNSMILVKNEYRKELLVVMHSNTKIESFQADQSLTMHIIDGMVKFKTRHHSINLYPGQFFTFSDNAKYSFICLEESTIIMTLNNIQIPQ